MKTARLIRRLLPLWLMLAAFAGPAAESPLTTSLLIANGKPQLSWTPILGADLYEIYSTPELGVLPFSSDYSGSITGLTFTRFSMSGDMRFFRVTATAMSSNDLLAGIALNRLAYGPTPDDLELLLDRHPVTGLTNTSSTNFLRWTNQTGQEFSGAAAYIAQQLEPWRISETVTNTHTNIAFIGSKFLARTQVPVFIVTNPTAGIYGIPTDQQTNAFYTMSTNAQLTDLQAWFIQHAIGAKRQLLEVLLQFFDNHFTTQATKSTNYLSGAPIGVRNNISIRGAHAYNWEFWEIDGWRQVLLDPTCTFYDLLKISAESPAQIVYLDTLGSRGDGSNVPNENYALELLGLFTMGKDNGYEQTDITELSKVWTGWKVALVHPTNAFNPLTPINSSLVQSSYTNCIPGARNVVNSNLFAVSTFVYYSAHHRTGNKLLWTNYTSDSTGPAGTTKKIPARFGTDWASDEFKAGYDYSLSMTDTNLTRGTNSIQEGYLVLQRLNDLPFTAENICIKLCRLLVHDNFPSPTTRLALTNDYNFYDYTNPSRTAEAELVRQCLRAWESTTPKGQIWKVVETIVNSDLFRTQTAASQKIKTPLEFSVSAIRALRSSTNGTGMTGSFSASTDGYALSRNSSIIAPLPRMGGMDLFNCPTASGWPEEGASWLSVVGVIERVRWAQSLCINVGQNGKTESGNSVVDVRGLIYSKLPANAWTNTTLVADYLVRVIYPTEGRGNVDTYHKMAVTFLNDGSADSFPLDRTKNFSQLTADSTANSSYDIRLRGAAALLLSFQRFQEQ